ncbi:MAG TPA: SDR family oxidoreductase [Vicinamibacterales bacterium]
MSSLSGKVAVVTGGSRGIGLAVARLLGQRGAAVAITGTSAAGLETAAEALKTDAVLVLPLRADVRDAVQMEAAMAQAASVLGGIDVVVNNAGVGVFKPVADLSLDDWRLMFETNVTGVFNSSRAALPHLRARGGGWVINVSSLSGTNPFPGGAAYCATKAAVNAFSEAFMQEVRHDGIRVAYVSPGSVDTSFGGGARDKSSWALQPDDVAHVIGDLLNHPGRSLPSRVEIRPSQPPRKG